MIKQLQAMRTCSICGQKKGLGRLFGTRGGKGHTYGDICSTCRGEGRGRKERGDDTTETKESLRLQIDNKTKVQLEKDKKDLSKEFSDRNLEEKAKKEGLAEEKLSEEEKQKAEETKYREAFLAQKKQSIANKENTSSPREAQQISQAQGFYQEKARITQDGNKQTSEQMLGKKTSGLSPEYVQRYVAVTGRSAESLFGNLLGQFMRGHLNSYYKTSGQKPGQKAGPEAKAAGPNAAVKGQQADKTAPKEENTTDEFVKNNFGRKR